MFDGVDDSITGSQLSSCICVRAVVDKHIRMYRLAGVADGTREILPLDIPITGHFIRAGLNIESTLHALQHHQEKFDDPREFCPKHSLVGESFPTASVTEIQSASFPFSSGSRAGPGKILTYEKIGDSYSETGVSYGIWSCCW